MQISLVPCPVDAAEVYQWLKGENRHRLGETAALECVVNHREPALAIGQINHRLSTIKDRKSANACCANWIEISVRSASAVMCFDPLLALNRPSLSRVSNSA